MDFLLYGTDARLKPLARLLHQNRHRVLSWEGPEGAHITPIASPLSLSGPVRLVLPQTADKSLVLRALSTLPLQSRVFGGAFPEDEECEKKRLSRRIFWVNLAEDEVYCKRNAVLTAEGVLYHLLALSEKCLADTHVALTGSGHVAEACVHLFEELSVDVTVCARSREARRALRRRGHRTLPLPADAQRAAALGDADLLVNTVPVAGIVDRTILSALPRKAPVLDLVRGGFCVDLDAAKEKEHPVSYPGALPGLLSPQSAAKALCDAITQTKDDAV